MEEHERMALDGTSNLLRLGFAEDDLRDGGSDRAAWRELAALLRPGD